MDDLWGGIIEYIYVHVVECMLRLICGSGWLDASRIYMYLICFMLLYIHKYVHLCLQLLFFFESAHLDLPQHRKVHAVLFYFNLI